MVTELRVHGVGGATPEGVLNDGPAQLVAGDAEAGFYATKERPDAEAYCWGNLTSGTASRALWLLALPFTLVNASFWMGPVRRSNEALVRLLALSLTATAALAAEGVGTDLMGWQCAAKPECRNRHVFLRFLGHGYFASPGRRAAVGAVVPLATLLVLWVLARRTARFERIPTTSGRQGAPLEDPTFWHGAQQVDRLRQLHVSVGLAVVGLGMAWPVQDHDRGGLQLAERALVVGCWLVMVLASVGVCLPSVVRRRPPGERAPVWPKALQAGALLIVLAAALLALLPSRSGWVPKPTLPGYDVAVTAVFVTQVAGVLVLAVLAGRTMQAVFGALGLLFAAVFSAGTAFRVADWLDGGKNPTDGNLHLPFAYEWTAVGFTVVAVPGVLVLGGLAYQRFSRARRAGIATVREVYGQPAGLDDRVAVVAKARALAGLTDAAFGWIRGMTVACIAGAATSMALTVVLDEPPGAVHDGSGFLRFLTLAGTWLVSGVVAGLVFVGYRSYRQASLRKTVGILWDLGTFWPRAAHPLAPPCYAERCIPDLTTRVGYLVERDGGALLSAHSQGTVIAAALMWQLPPEVVSRTRLLTHGSPLARLYGRAYPAWFGPAEIDELQARVGSGHWVNLWRPTDPIGGPVHTSADRRLDHDPDQLDRLPGDPSYRAPRGHLDHDLTPDYAAAVAELEASL